ncbi:hypothetical protein ACHAWT_003587 [Skeletonema menzelii]
MMSRRLLLLIAALTASAGNAAKLRNFQLQREIDLMEERIDMLEEQLESKSATCTSDDECSGLPHCDNGYGNECYCELPMGVCDGDFLAESETGHCVKPRLGCTKSLIPVLGCDGKYYGNPSCAQAVAVNVLCDMRADPDCTIPDPADADKPTSSDME